LEVFFGNTYEKAAFSTCLLVFSSTGSAGFSSINVFLICSFKISFLVVKEALGASCL
jgi:hypothetical protein